MRGTLRKNTSQSANQDFNLTFSLTTNSTVSSTVNSTMRTSVNTDCPLCFTQSKNHCPKIFFTDQKSGHNYYHCSQCDLRFLDPLKHLNSTQEFARYKIHQNDVTDVNYQNFVRPMLQLVIKNTKPTEVGLDYGCGEASALSHLLTQYGYNKVSLYDPYFKPDHALLSQKYDFIIATEVAEHFYKPHEEFHRFKNLLSTQGSLGIMTSLFTELTNFETWHYRRDPTHVCFYSEATFKWIAKYYDFKSFECCDNRMIWLSFK